MEIFLRIYKYLIPYWRQLLLSIFFTILFSLMSGISIYLTIPLLETLFSDSGQKVVLMSSQSLSFIESIKFNVENWLYSLIFSGTKENALFIICSILGTSYVLKNILDYAQMYYMVFVEQKLMMNLRNDVYQHLHNLSLSYFTSEKTGHLISRITNDVNVVNSGISTSFVTLIKQPLLIIVFLGMSFLISWKLTLLALIVFPFVLIVISSLGLRVHRESGILQERMADITAVLQETISNVKVVKAFAMEEFENNKFMHETKKYFQSMLKITRIRNLGSPITELLSILAAVIIIWFGGRQVLITEEMRASEFFGCLFILFQIMPPIKDLASVANRMQEFSAAGKRIFEILDTPIAINNSKNAIEFKKINNSIEFKNVSFAYRDHKNIKANSIEVLNNISFTINKGEVIAIVGPSGSGKTTLVDLIPRFYDVSNGEILFDGKDLKSFTLQSIRSQIGIVTQETILFNDTIKNNIAYGMTDCSMSKIISAAKAANALDFINESPEKFETIIGDRGVKLSGGQRQRISIARALLKNPPIMILDEATSALDTESELLVQDAIVQLMKHRTSFVIAHRLSTIRHADRIIVLNKGKIVQMGKHSNLIKQENGLYKKLYTMQFAE